ncbi:MAG: glycosyltransferase family 2 protein [Desulforhopalus sp.]|nr:glycosyltransferase family 2 protein [Desulforhopalus sp.]
MNFLPVTVIIPTYNRRIMLKRAMDSVFRQSWSCAELVVVDDGSEDGTAEMLAGISVKEPRLRLLTTAHQGPSAARNAGIAAATEKYIAFLDSDDHWQKRKLEKQYAALSASDFLISHTRERWLRLGEHLNQKKIHIPRHGDIFAHCLQVCAVSMSTLMVRRDLFTEVGLFDESLRCCEDYDLWLRIALHYPFLLVDEALTVKEGGREDQVSFQYQVGMDALRIKSLRKLLAGTMEPPRRCLALAELIRKITIYAGGCCKHGREEEGAALFVECVGFKAELAALSYNCRKGES